MQWLPVLALLVAFIVTLIPFLHGAMRHLDDVYLLDTSAAHAKPAALAVDFFFLFGEGVILFLLAHWLVNPQLFLTAAVALLVTDMCWAMIYHLLAPETRRASVQLNALLRSLGQSEIAQREWFKNNFLFTVLLLVSAWPVGDLWLGFDSRMYGILLASILLLRTVRDYKRSWSFYFPHSASQRQGAN